MADPVMQDFYGRLSRVEYANQRGAGFAAAGTLGRIPYDPSIAPAMLLRRRRRKGLRIPVLGPVLVLVLGVTGIKAGIHHSIGATVYEEKVERLWQSDGIERFGAVLMQPDPLTLYLSGQIAELRR